MAKLIHGLMRETVERWVIGEDDGDGGIISPIAWFPSALEAKRQAEKWRDILGE